MGKGILLLVLYIDLGMLLVPENAEDFAAGRNPLLTVFLESAELDQFQLTPEGRPIQTKALCNCTVNCFHDPGPFPIFPGATMRFRGEALNSLMDVKFHSHLL